MRRIVSAVSFLMCALSVAQDRGTITGTVTDPVGAPVPGAKITVRNPATNLSQEMSSSEDGNYSVPYLPAGVYRIDVEKAGFSKAQLSDVQVNVNTTTRADVRMQVGDVQQVVEVTAAAPLLQTDRTDLGKVVPSRAIRDLPLFLGGGLREPLAFVNLIPGVQGNVNNPRIGGGLLSGASLLLDGAESNSERRNDAGFNAVSAEALEEFKVQTGSYSAEYGRTSNGIVNFTTKSGTNELHGSGFYFNRNEVFNARRFTFAPGTREVNRQHLYGFSVGGPALIPKLYDGRNKTFFFTAFEKSRYRSGPPSNVISLPINEFRNGDFRRYVDASGNQIPLYDPIDANGQIITDAFARPRMQCNGVLNVICPDRIHPIARQLNSLLPQPDDPSQPFNNTRAVSAGGNDNDVFSVKGDHAFSDRHRINSLFSRYVFGSPPNIGPIPGALGENFTSGGTNKFYRVNHDYIFRPNLLNHFTFGYNSRDIFEAGPLRIDDATKQAIQLKGTTNPPTLQPTQYVIPEFPGNNSALNRSIDTLSPSRTINLNEQIAYIKDKHNLKFGFQYLLAKYSRFDCNGCSGEISFANATTGNPGVSARNGSSYAAFLLGLASGGNFNYSANIEFYFPYYAWYVQDDWKLTNKLTLNYGLRYEISYPKAETNRQNSNFNPAIPNPGAGGILGALEFAGDGPGRSGRTRLQETRQNGFGPRAGLAYQLRSNTVIRAGAAIGYQAMREDGNADNGVQGFGGRFTALTDYLATGVSFRLDNGLNEFGNMVQQQRPPRIDPSLLNYGTPTYMTGEAGRSPMFYDWNATVEHSFYPESLLRVSYHANVGVRLLNNRQNFNQLDPRWWSVYGDLLGRRLDDPQVIATGFTPPYAGYPLNRQLQQALRPYPQYNGLNTGVGGENSGHFTYHALETSFEHRFGQGLYFLASYTFSKLMANVEGENPGLGGFVGETSGAQQNQYNRSADKSVSNQDTPHNLVLSYVYELPVGRGKKYGADLNPVVNAFVGNWKISGVQRYTSGLPLRVTSGQNLFGAGGTARASFVPGQPLKNPNFDAATPNKPNNPYINPAAFRRPQNMEYGDTPPLIAQLRGPITLNEDIAVLKSIYWGGERRYIELRASAFNIFNRHRLGGIDQNFDSTTFGQVTNPQVNSPREIQLGVKIYF